MRRLLTALVFILFCSSLSFAQEEQSDVPDIQWERGPMVATLGDNLAEIVIDSNYVFTGPENTKTLMTLMGNPPSDQEIGLISPQDSLLNWFVLFEFKPVGYVSDKDKGDIKPDKLLKSIKDATDASNNERVKMGGRPLHVVGWYEEPHYDEASNNLVWAILAESDGDTVVNYNTRLLGRTGFTSVVIVSSIEQLNAVKGDVVQLLGGFTYKDGKRYSEYVKGDKIAKYGLTALVAGGAGAAAVKFGLFKFIGKLWKAIVVGVIAAFAALKNFFKRLFGGNTQTQREIPEQKKKLEE
jgi:uncharacterized membrane-anchored protein